MGLALQTTMAIHYRYLSEELFPETHATMVEAFSDYQVDMSYMTAERSWQRNLKSGVHYDCSAGAFDGDRMVGMTFVGLDDWQGEPAAFDAGTGIILPYRGMGIAGGMFRHILPRLRERGIGLFLLEVLQPNEPAIKAYSRTGFEITREFGCYDLPTGRYVASGSGRFDVRPVDQPTVHAFRRHLEWQPSWEHSYAGMDRIRGDIVRLGAYDGDDCVGVLVYYPLLQWLMNLVVDPAYRRRGVASSLLDALVAHVGDSEDIIKVNNIDRSDRATLALVEKAGAVHVIDQYEMAYRF